MQSPRAGKHLLSHPQPKGAAVGGERNVCRAVAQPLRLKAGVLAVVAAWLLPAGTVVANPVGGVAVVGQATVTQSGSRMVVTTQNGTGTQYSAINWQGFSVPAGSSTYFQQPGSTSTVVNRVVTATPSLIYGTLGSNGRVVLVNQSGITVGAGAVVDTAAFTAAAMRMSDADFTSGRLRFGDAAASGGTVDVQGQILARSGDVVLIGQRVQTGAQALVQAPNGSAVLAAGQQVEITGRGLEGIALLVQAPTDEVVNLGSIKGNAVGLFAGTLRHSGVAEAVAVQEDGGRVYLKATNAVAVDGQSRARGLLEKGGSIQVTAPQVNLGAGANLDASGRLGGGEVLVGGGFQGVDARLANATNTVVDAGAVLKADALDAGNGGSVVVWADGTTRYAGALSARGGASGGNGGRAEVSGKGTLLFEGSADLRATSGAVGSLLLDPTNLIIGINTAGVATVNSGTEYADPAYAGPFNPPSPTVTVSASSIGTLLETTNVTLAASQDITLTTSLSKLSGTGATTLTLNAGRDINLGDPVNPAALSIYSYSGVLNLTLDAGRNLVGSNATLSVSDANVVLKAGTGNLSIGSITAKSLDVTSGGSATFASASNQVGSLNATVGGTSGFTFNNHSSEVPSEFTITGLKATGGAVTIDNWGELKIAGNMSAAGNLSLTSHNAIILSGNLTAGGNVSVSAASGTLAANSNVTLKASQDISLMTSLSRSSGAGTTTLTFNADRDITLGDVASATTVDINGNSGVLNVTLNAGRSLAGSNGTLSVAESNVVLKAGTGTVSIGSIKANSLNVNSAGDATFASSSNQVANLNATVGGSSGLSFYNHSAGAPGTFTVTGVKASAGSVTVDNYGALSITGDVSAAGSLSLTAHSPITVSANMTATGNVNLSATSSDSTSNIRLDTGRSIRSTGGRVDMTAYNNIDQFGYVYGAAGVNATAQNGRINFGLTGYSGGSPLSYSQSGVSVTAPTAPLIVALSGSSLGDMSTSPLDTFLDALSDASNSSNPFDPANRDKDVLLVEGQMCTP